MTDDPDKKPAPPPLPAKPAGTPWYKPAPGVGKEITDGLFGYGCLALIIGAGYLAYTMGMNWYHLHHGTSPDDVKARQTMYRSCLDECEYTHRFTEVDKTRCQDGCVATWKQ